MLGMDLIELVPDQPVIGGVAAGEGDLRAGGQQHLVVCASFGGEEIAAVDHRGGHLAMVDLRAVARRPGCAGSLEVDVSGGLPEDLHAVAPFNQALADADQRFQLDGFDLGAVLFALEALLCLLVAVELGLDPLDRAVEGVDGRPEDFVEVEIEAGVGHGGNQGVEDVGYRTWMVWSSGVIRGSASSSAGR